MAKYDAMRKLRAEGRERAPDRPLVLPTKRPLDGAHRRLHGGDCIR